MSLNGVLVMFPRNNLSFNKKKKTRKQRNFSDFKEEKKTAIKGPYRNYHGYYLMTMK